MLRHLVAVTSVLGLVACGGSSPHPNRPGARPLARSAPAARGPRVDDRGRGMRVSGLHGTLSPRQVRAALRPHMDALTGCFAMRSMSFEHLGGQLRMAIHVDGGGRVVRAHPEDSTVGDREVERCVARIIRGARFPRTQGGGEARVRWALSIEPPRSARPASTWSPERVERVVRRRGARELERCNASPGVQVTAYVSPRGRVLNVGAASADGHDEEVLDCVASRVRRWRMPRARRVTKVTFEIG